MKKIVIIGASGHGKVVVDIARLNGYDEIVFLDDNKETGKCAEYSIVGTSDMICDFDCDFFVAIGDAQARKKMIMKLDNVATLVHPKAVVAQDVEIGKGTVIMAGAVINPGAKIGDGVIINTCASVDHDCTVGDYVHIAVGAHIAGTVNIGENTWIGAGAVVTNNVSIPDDCMIGAGSVVIKNIEKKGTYVGVPARWLHE